MTIQQVIDSMRGDIVNWSDEIACLESHDKDLLSKFWDSLKDDGGLLYDRDQYIKGFLQELAAQREMKEHNAD